ncbi:site-specific DNA-methyltransferase [Hyphomonas sp.]|uniref:site-specific DNA-methyltransferase n=1 Tax=Hyphomonas sp. TaxID=87 RepID=UPI0030F5CA8A
MTEISFKGKEFVYNHHLSVPFRPLEMHPDKGIGAPRLDGNLIIQGDNLHALKALLPMYAGKVDCVFIDPPYNTGNEGWAYNDNVNAPMIKEWLESNPIGIDDGLRHDKWCAMMWPRLSLLRELLSERGSIWVTLDSNEVHRAKLMMDEIFGLSNALGTLVWEKSDSPRMDAHTFSSSNDFILAYSKNSVARVFNRLSTDDDDLPEHYNMTDEDGRIYYLKPLRAMGGQGETREARPKLHYPLISPIGSEVFPKLQDGGDGAWRWSREKVEAEAYRIEWREGKNGWTPYFRIYADSSDGRPPETIWYHKDVGSSRLAKAQIKEIFGEAAFDTPKPIGVVARVLEIASSSDSIVLDSFSGSGTTAQAVLEANEKDGGKRKFILVEMEKYADALTAERARRVIAGYAFSGTKRTELHREKLNWSKLANFEKIVRLVEDIGNLHGDKFNRITKTIKDSELIVTGEETIIESIQGLGGEFTYCTLGPPIELDSILMGESLPAYEGLGGVLFHMATNTPIDPATVSKNDYFLGEVNGLAVWLIYKPDLNWLKSPDAALTLSFARKIVSAGGKDRRHLVFAPARFVGQKMLAEENLPVEFAPLPFALYRVERG